MVVEAKRPVYDAPEPPKPEPKPEEPKVLPKRFGRPKAGSTEDLKIQFGIWLGLPPDARQADEKTQEEFAKKIGVTLKTLIQWKSDPGVQETARNSMRILGGNRKMKIIDKLMSMAEMGDVAAIKLYLEWQGEIGQRAMDIEKKRPRSMELILTTDAPKE